MHQRGKNGEAGINGERRIWGGLEKLRRTINGEAWINGEEK